MRIFMSLMCFILWFQMAYSQAISEPTSSVGNLLNDVFIDKELQKMIDEVIEDCPTKYCDTALVGKFRFCLSEGGQLWFNRFISYRDRVRFYQNRHDTIQDYGLYYDKEIKNLDYDSITFNYEDNHYIQMFDGTICETYDVERYTFFKSQVKVKTIAIGFKGGEEFAFYYDHRYVKRKKEFWRISESGEVFVWYE